MTRAQQCVENVVGALYKRFQLGCGPLLIHRLAVHSKLALFPVIEAHKCTRLLKMLSHDEAIAAVVAWTDQEEHFEAVQGMVRQEMGFEEVGGALARVLH